MSFGTVICSALQTIPHLLSASVFLVPGNDARERIGRDRTPAAGLNKRWNLISCLRPAIENRAILRREEVSGGASSAIGRKKEEEEEEEKERLG